MAEYNSAHTGPEIDAAVAAVKSKEATWDNKQAKITGTAGQVVGFDANGNPVAQEAPSGGGGVSSWNDLTDKPVVLEGGDTLTWDGNTEGRTMVDIGDGSYMVHVSDAVPTMDDFASGGSLIAVYYGENNEIPLDSAQVTDTGVGALLHQMMYFIVVAEDRFETDGIVFPVNGVYFLYVPGVVNIHSLTIPSYTGFATEKLDPAYLPKHTHSWNDLADKPFGEVYGDTVTFDGNTNGVVNVEGVFFKVSDAVPTYADIVKGGHVITGGGTLEFTAEDVPESEAVLPSGIVGIGNAVIIVPPEAVGVTTEEFGFAFPESGTYFVYSAQAGALVTELQLNGYTEFATVKKIEQKYIHSSFGKLYFSTTKNDKFLYTDEPCTIKATVADVPDTTQFMIGLCSGAAASAWLSPLSVYSRLMRNEAGFCEVTAAYGGNFVTLFTAEYPGS